MLSVRARARSLPRETERETEDEKREESRDLCTGMKKKEGKKDRDEEMATGSWKGGGGGLIKRALR